MDTIQHDMLGKARKHRDAHTYTALGWDEFVETIHQYKARLCKSYVVRMRNREDKDQRSNRCNFQMYAIWAGDSVR